MTKQIVSNKVVTSGLSNKIYMSKEHNILVRIYGQQMSSLVDRERERRVINLLDSSNIGPKLLFEFPEGRIEELLDATPIELEQYTKSMPKIVSMMKTMHQFRNSENNPPSLERDIAKWTSLAKKLDVQGDFYEFFSQKERLIKKIQESASGEIMLTHNDLHFGNILISKDEEIKFIDFEYSDYNNYEYDIANHLTELSIKYTDHSYQIEDIDTNLKSRFVDLYAGNIEEKDHLNRVLPIFTMASHYLWGTWSVIKAHTDKSSSFPYKKYAIDRFKMFNDLATNLLPN